MCIYCSTSNYRKIFKNHYGEIPKDETGRSYDIHHIDGNHMNNDPKNLKAVSLKEHYEIHYSQGDYGAALKIAARLQLSAQEMSELGKLEQQKRVLNGTHNFLGGERTRLRVKNGTHNFLGPTNNKRNLKNGSHVSQIPESLAIISSKAKIREREKVQNGTHKWLSEEHSRSTSDRNKKLLLEGRHPSQIKMPCQYCGGKYALSPLSRYHGDRCKFK